MIQKGCECREGEMEEWKQNWNEVFMDEEREKEERKEWREMERRGGERKSEMS
jgi:hypothetical protein